MQIAFSSENLRAWLQSSIKRLRNLCSALGSGGIALCRPHRGLHSGHLQDSSSPNAPIPERIIHDQRAAVSGASNWKRSQKRDQAEPERKHEFPTDRARSDRSYEARRRRDSGRQKDQIWPGRNMRNQARYKAKTYRPAGLWTALPPMRMEHSPDRIACPWWRSGDSNPGPDGYEPPALTAAPLRNRGGGADRSRLPPHSTPPWLTLQHRTVALDWTFDPPVSSSGGASKATRPSTALDLRRLRRREDASR